MPRVRTAVELGFGTTQASASPTPYQSLSTNADMFGAAQGRAATQAAAGLEKASDEIGNIAITQRKNQDVIAGLEVEDAIRQWKTEKLYGDDGALKKKGADALGVSKTLDEEFRLFSAGLTKGRNASPAAMAKISSGIQKERDDLVKQMGAYEASEQDAHLKGLLGARVTTAQQDAALYYNDPAKVESARAKILTSNQSLGARFGWTPEEVQAKNAEAVAEMHKGVVNRMMADNKPEEARAYLEKAMKREGQSFEWAEKVNEELAGARVRLDIMDNPTAAQKNLMTGAYEGLSVGQSAVWLQRANEAAEAEDRKALTQRTQAETAAEKARKRAEEEKAKEGEKLHAEGTLTPEWIEANRNTLDKTDYRYLYGKLRGEDAVTTDPVRYADLRERAGQGEDVRAEAKTGIVDKWLKREDYDRLVSLSEKGLVEGELPSWFKRGDAFIKNALAVGEAVDDPFGRLRQANAMDEWYRWSRENPKATDQQAEQAYKRITTEQALVNFENNVAVMPLPRFLAVPRNKVDAPSLDAAEQELVRAFDAGEMERGEFERQATLFERWRSAVEARDKAKEQ
jgi:hypothetical protein